MASNAPSSFNLGAAMNTLGSVGTALSGAISPWLLPLSIGASLFGGENVSGLTQSDINRAEAAVNNSYNAAQDALTSPYNISGTVSTPAKSAKEVKQENKAPALNLYAQTVLGKSPAEAEKWTKKQLNNDKTLNQVGKKQDISFKEFIRQGNAPGLEVSSTGKIKGIASDPGATGRRDPLEEAQIGLSQEVFGAAGGLPGLYGEDARAGLNFRNQIRQALSDQYLGGDLQDVLNADLAQIQDFTKDATQNAFGSLMDSGFLSSNLAGEAFDRSVGSGQRKMSRDLLGKMAELRSNEVRNILGAAQTLGGPSTFGGYISGGLQAPGAYGGISDAQALDAITGQQRTGASLEAQRGNTLSNVLTTNRYADSGGGLF